MIGGRFAMMSCSAAGKSTFVVPRFVPNLPVVIRYVVFLSDLKRLLNSSMNVGTDMDDLGSLCSLVIAGIALVLFPRSSFFCFVCCSLSSVCVTARYELCTISYVTSTYSLNLSHRSSSSTFDFF